MKFCNRCGYRMDDNDRFCFNCGAPYSEPQVQVPQPAPVPMPQQGSMAPPPVWEVKKQEVVQVRETEKGVSEITGDLAPRKAGLEEVQGATELLKTVEKEDTYAVLNYLENGNPREYRMNTRLLNIGRDKDNCEIIINWDKFISRNHALIYTKKDKFFIVDLNSKNGTFVDGEKVNGIMELKKECSLKIAETEIAFKSAI